MLRSLDIRDMLIIDRLEMEFQPGLNVLTGETGTGKSIVLGALGFVLGWRGPSGLVRAGAARGEVTASFDLPEGHRARAVLIEVGVPVEDELIMRRINWRDGRKQAWINDRRCSAEILRTVSATLVELHGQRDDRGLLDSRGHRRLLDAFAGDQSALALVGDAWRARREAVRAREQAEAEVDAARADEAFLRHAVAELDALAPQPGEAGELDARRRLMRAAEHIRGDIARADMALGNDGAEGAVGDALRWLEDVAEHAEGRLDAPIAALGRAFEELGQARAGVADCLAALGFDPHELEQAEERLFAIRALARKHAVGADELAELARAFQARLAALDQGEADTEALRRSEQAAQARYDVAAARLRATRQRAAGRLDAAMARELAPLKMERAVFTTRIEACAPGPDGGDAVAFRVATNPGAAAGPIGKIASGGELSRFLLALKVCLTSGSDEQTLIFDEIDRGVGGATADAVGRRLKALAEGGQVLVVTHSPQVAAQAAHHWRVEKRLADGVALSAVVALDPAARVDEIARMLAGDTVTDEARAAARALLDAAGGAVATA